MMAKFLTARLDAKEVAAACEAFVQSQVGATEFDAEASGIPEDILVEVTVRKKRVRKPRTVKVRAAA
jgi:hypothetical protein